jgi:hypothetical protein
MKTMGTSGPLVIGFELHEGFMQPANTRTT